MVGLVMDGHILFYYNTWHTISFAPTFSLAHKLICMYMHSFPPHLDFQQRMDPSDNIDIELVKCGAYEVVKLSRQRVTMNDNPAYGEISVGIHIKW